MGANFLDLERLVLGMVGTIPKTKCFKVRILDGFRFLSVRNALFKSKTLPVGDHLTKLAISLMLVT